MDELLLKKYPSLTKKIKEFHPFQLKAIDAILHGESNLVIAPTGKGKSLIYQIAGQELKGVTIVVSPLIALINEQVEYLGNELALSLSSTLNFQEQRKVLKDLANGTYRPKFIFVSPERLQNYFFRSALKKSGMAISLVVVDEAHCISQWGFDFRPEYSQIPYFLDFLCQIGPKPVILAMTATIGSLAQKEIVREFSISELFVFYDDDVLRKELKLTFIEVEKEREKPDKILELIKDNKPQKALIYFYDKKHCRGVAQMLNDRGISAATFYSGMEGKNKDENYRLFKSGEINVLCATTAFGMGMNIPDIDMVIHHRLPDSIEEYYQQVGRAARDKSLCPAAKCFALWSETNFEYKYNEFIPAVILRPEAIDDAFLALGLTGKAQEAQSIEYSDYIRQDLGRIRYELEKRGILITIGEVNGTIKSIEFRERNPKWEEIKTKMKFGNSFIRAAYNSNIELQELIDFIFEKELNNEIKKFPALEKKIFFVSDYDEVPLRVTYSIVEDSMKWSAFKEEQVNKLKEMVDAENHEKYIKDYFGRTAERHVD
jgi:ATP-dependent DNA helicase RecQ